MSPVVQGCERASKCAIAPRGTWLSKPVRSRCFRTVDFGSEGLNASCGHLFVRKSLPTGLMPGHNRGCPNRQSIGADAWQVLSQRDSANGIARLNRSFPGGEFHINFNEPGEYLPRVVPGSDMRRTTGYSIIDFGSSVSAAAPVSVRVQLVEKAKPEAQRCGSMPWTAGTTHRHRQNLLTGTLFCIVGQAMSTLIFLLPESVCP